MTYRGHINNGVAVLDEHVDLPDGTPVRIEVEPNSSDFWHGKSAEELIREQGIKPVANLGDLVVDWPADESLDDFMTFLREVRR